jgi:hypothetical protein
MEMFAGAKGRHRALVAMFTQLQLSRFVHTGYTRDNNNLYWND